MSGIAASFVHTSVKSTCGPTQAGVSIMTECNAEPCGFSRPARKNVVADFAGRTIAWDAGWLLRREWSRLTGVLHFDIK